MTMVAQQRDVWRDYYEEAWAARANLVRSMIDGHETQAYRLIKRLEAHERKFELVRGPDGVQYRRRYEDHAANGLGGMPPFRPSSIRGQEIQVPFHATDNMHNFIIDYMSEKGAYDCVVELGCGYGRNLFEIFYCSGATKIAYFGGELTESGIALARAIAALEPAMDVSFFHFDYMKPDLAAVPKVDRALVFTMHSIEQVRNIDPALFGVIRGIARHVTCIHLEPFGFQLANLGPVSKAHTKYAQALGMNDNFIPALMAAKDRSWLTIDMLATEMFLPSHPHNPTSLAIWTSDEARGS